MKLVVTTPVHPILPRTISMYEVVWMIEAPNTVAHRHEYGDFDKVAPYIKQLLIKGTPMDIYWFDAMGDKYHCTIEDDGQ